MISLPELPFWIDKKYRAHRLLGQGGGGFALLADWGDKKTVVKILRIPVTQNRERAVEKFKKEFLTLKQLKHPHIGELFDFGYDATHDFYYFAGEYVDGRDILEVSRHLTPDHIEVLFVQALQALHYLNSFGRAGLRHNDIKVPNLLVDQSGEEPQLKLIDFGLSKLAPLDVLGGTASYMAPEQILHFLKKRVEKSKDPVMESLLRELPKLPKPDQRADLYSLGVAWYLCITGINPFFIPQDTIGSFKRHFSTSPSPPSQIRPDSPKYFDDILLRLLARHPNERFETPAQVIQELNFLGGKKYSVIPGEMRHDYLPEREWIQSSGAFQELKRIWQSATPAFLRIVGETGQGKTSLLEELKSHVQAHDGKFFLWEETENKENLFESPGSILIATEQTEHLQEILAKVDYHLSWQGEEAPVIQVVVTGTDSGQTKWATRLPIKTIHLKNLTLEELKKRLLSLTKNKKGEVPPKFSDSLLRHTQGNPRLLSHILRELMRQGLLIDDRGHWDARLLSDSFIDLSRLSLPEELQQQLEYFWERLSEGSQDILKWIAIAPEGLSEADLFALNPHISYAELTPLFSSGFVRRERHHLFFENPFWEKFLDAEMTTPEKRRRHQQMADHLREQKNPQHQVAIHQIFSENPKERVRAFHILIDFYQKTGDSDSQLKMLRVLQKEMPTAETGLRASQILRELGRLEEAARELATVRPVEPFWEALVWKEWGELKRQSGDREEARDFYEKALKILPLEHRKEGVSIRNRIAQSWLEERALPKAATLFEKTRKASMEFELGDNDLGHTYLLQQNPKGALKILTEDLALFEKIGDRRRTMRCHFLLASTLRQLERSFAKAIEHYHRGIEQARDLKDRDWLMRLLNGMAATYLDRAHEKNQPQDYNQALRYFQESLEICQHLRKNKTELDLETAALHLNIGMVHLELGEPVKARQSFETILKVLEPSPEKGTKERMRLCQTYIALADTYAAEGNFSCMTPPLNGATAILREETNFKEQRLALTLLLAEQAQGLGDRKELKRHMNALIKLQATEKICPTPMALKRIDALTRPR